MRNIEIKHELRDPDLARALCRALGAVMAVEQDQTDTYYKVADGFLKKRDCEGEPTEWVFYCRDRSVLPRVSRFAVYSDEEAKRRFGSRALPVWVVVKKKRQIWMKGAVRINIDRVDGLGDFLELEALVTPKQNAGVARRRVHDLREDLRIALGEPVSSSYADMLHAERENEKDGTAA